MHLEFKEVNIFKFFFFKNGVKSKFAFTKYGQKAKPQHFDDTWGWKVNKESSPRLWLEALQNS